MRYSKADQQAVEQAVDIRELFPDLKGKGRTRYCKCPKCGKEGKDKGLLVYRKKEGAGYVNGAKCYNCGYFIGGSVSAYMELKNVSYPTAMTDLIEEYNVKVSTKKTSKPVAKPKAYDPFSGSFCEMQLFASGLTLDDVMVSVPIKGTEDFKREPAFRKGGADYGLRRVNFSDDEMLIFYHDLDGNPMKFSERGGKGSMRDYFRIRYSNPALHKNKDDQEMKYQSPYGQPCAFFIPEMIRKAYRESAPIDTLVIQEGEKKAVKACKHGIPSLGIQGIYNIGNAESGLMKELQYIVQKCNVKNVVLLFDSDWDHLSRNLTEGCRIDQRPNQFAKATIKFKKYLETLHNIGLTVDIWFGHINDNERGDKGIDDLLVGTLHLKEDQLAKDLDFAMHAHDGIGKFVTVNKISTKLDQQILDFWHLNSRVDFCNKYRDQIKDLKSFRFSKVLYIVENGEVKTSSVSDAKLWMVSTNKEGDKKIVDFDDLVAMDFLSSNGFKRIRTIDLRQDDYKFVKIEDNVVSVVAPSQIREFVYDYVLKSVKDPDIIRNFIRKLNTWLGVDRLERLPSIKDDFYSSFCINSLTQNFFYRNQKVSINSDCIDCTSLAEYVWKSNMIDRKFRRVPVIFGIEKEGDEFQIEFTEEGMKSDFVNFIICTSNFWKGREASMTEEDYQIMYQHVVNKITAIGFLLCAWKPRSEQICIVASDEKMDEVGASNGRSGKTMIGEAIKQLINVQLIDGKSAKNNDEFIYSLVTPDTRMVFVDDVRVNFDFQNFYSALTGNLQVNPKTAARFEIQYDRAPKFYFTTNHAINDQSDSGKDRRMMMGFSNYFSANYSPFDHFGRMLFSDWDAEQWNLFDNFMMECVMFYLRSRSLGWTKKGRGVVPPPMGQLERRAMRQVMGESFLMWAEALFDPGNSVINYKVSRKELVGKYNAEFPNAKYQLSPQDFRRRMIAFCKFKGYHFNPNRRNEEGESFSEWIVAHPGETFIGEGHKSNGNEFWTIATDEFSKSQQW